VGEAYDKAAKMLGLGYPGGPEIDRLASQAGTERIAFGKPSVGDLNYSFSGLKTSFLNTLTKLFGAPHKVPTERLPEVCASIQDALLDHLLDKLVRAVAQTGLHSVAVAGGVSANSGLRRRLMELGKVNGWSIYLPPLAFTTDNAAMIGADGYFQRVAGIEPVLHVPAQARIPLQTLPAE
jgi:N6-L-threonylcarbamoyladenine synthase